MERIRLELNIPRPEGHRAIEQAIARTPRTIIDVMRNRIEEAKRNRVGLEPER